MINFFKRMDWLKLAKIIFILIIFYLLVAFSICLFKYLTFNYQSLDLAIFNQVFYNSQAGNLFNFTIHPTSYLGDHFAPIILILLPFYILGKSPLALIIIQALILALAVIPLYLIAKKYLSPWQTLLIIVLYLFNPLTLNINVDEFHLLALVPFFIFWTFYFYQNNKFKYFSLFVILSLLLREDIALIIFMFGIIAWLDKKSLKWILFPIITASIYFFTALKIVAYFSAASSYKFLLYYYWLGQNPREIIINLILKFHLVLAHIFSLANFELVLGLFLIFLFIPLFRPKYLLLGLGMFMQIILSPTSGEVIFHTHYSAVFLTALSLAAIFSLKALYKNQIFLKYLNNHKPLILLIVVICLIYNFFVLGPVIPAVKKVIFTDYQEIKLKKEFVKQIPDTASLVTTYDFITNLSSRPKIYALHYVFLGKQQYGAGDYLIPQDNQFILVNFDDFIEYSLQYKNRVSANYYNGAANIRNLLKNDYQLIKADQNLALWQKNSDATNLSLYQVTTEMPAFTNPINKNLENQIEFLGFQTTGALTSLYFKPLVEIKENLFIKINNRLFVLGYGIYPTSDWQANQIVQINFYNIESIKNIQILDIEGGIETDGMGSIKKVYDKVNILGEISLN